VNICLLIRGGKLWITLSALTMVRRYQATNDSSQTIYSALASQLVQN